MAAAFGDRAFPGAVCSTVGRTCTWDVPRGQGEEWPAAQQPKSHLASPGKAVNTARFLPWPGGAGLGTNRGSKSTGAAARFGLETAFGQGVASAEHPEAPHTQGPERLREEDGLPRVAPWMSSRLEASVDPYDLNMCLKKERAWGGDRRSG